MVRDVRAECEKCGKVWETKNAQAVAARHAPKCGGNVLVSVHMMYTVKPTKAT